MVEITPELLAKPGTEDSHQTALFCWINNQIRDGVYPDLKWCHAVPNGGERSQSSAARMKATGVRKGIWDIAFPFRVGNKPGLIIEMKKPEMRHKKNGGLSAEQIQYGTYMQGQGWCLHVCYSWEEAKTILILYMQGQWS